MVICIQYHYAKHRALLTVKSILFLYGAKYKAEKDYERIYFTLESENLKLDGRPA